MIDDGLTVVAMGRSDDDLRAFHACFERNTGGRAAARLRWQYLDGPVDNLLVDLAVDGAQTPPRVAAIYAVVPVPFRVAGRTVVGSQSLDTLTDRDYRGRGLFVRLAADVYARASRAGVGFVYGFPNSSSAPGFVNKLGWSLLDPVPFLLKPLRLGYFLRRVPRVGAALAAALPDARLAAWRDVRPPAGHRFAPLARFDAATDRVWEAFARGLTVAVARDQAYMNWRFVAKPGSRYALDGVFDRDGLVGYAVSTVAAKHGGTIGYVMELAYAPAAGAAGAALLNHVVRRFSAAGCDAALAWCFDHAPNRGAYGRAGFVALPERWRPITLHFGVRVLDPALGPTLAARRNWYISYCDSDTV